MPDDPVLVTIPNVDILSTGTYDLASGNTTFTADDLRDAISAAMDDPTIRLPRLKLGHTSKWGDAEPAFGKVDNLRLSEDEQTIIGDYVGVPAWLAEIMPSAYPSRSVEGDFFVESAAGKKYSLVLDAVALLGVRMPGVGSLEDLQGLYTEEVPELAIAAGTHVVAKNIGGHMPERRVAAAVEVEDVRRSFYDTLDSSQGWWWIRAIRLDPQDLIVDDDEGQLYRVPWEVSGDTISFGDPVAVHIEYEDDSEDDEEKTAASRGEQHSIWGRTAAVYASRRESRPDSQRPEEVTAMDGAELRQTLGLAEDASDEDVQEEVKRLKAEAPEEPAPTPNPDPDPDPDPDDDDDDEDEPTGQVPEGHSVIDDDTLADLKDQAKQGVAARRQQLDEERDRFLNQAVQAGKFPPGRREHYQKAWAADPQGTRQLIESLAAGLVPTDERGEAPSDDSVAASGDAYPPSWFPEIHSDGDKRVTQEA